VFGTHAAVASGANRAEVVNMEITAAVFGEYMTTFVAKYSYFVTTFKVAISFKILTVVCQPHHLAKFLGYRLLARSG
jgi:hypothetical protein